MLQNYFPVKSRYLLAALQTYLSLLALLNVLQGKEKWHECASTAAQDCTYIE